MLSHTLEPPKQKLNMLFHTLELNVLTQTKIECCSILWNNPNKDNCNIYPNKALSSQLCNICKILQQLKSLLSLVELSHSTSHYTLTKLPALQDLFILLHEGLLSWCIVEGSANRDLRNNEGNNGKHVLTSLFPCRERERERE